VQHGHAVRSRLIDVGALEGQRHEQLDVLLFEEQQVVLEIVTGPRLGHAREPIGKHPRETLHLQRQRAGFDRVLIAARDQNLRVDAAREGKGGDGGGELSTHVLRRCEPQRS
jgi:hypothetical protein